MGANIHSRFRRWWTGNGAAVFFMKYVPVASTFAMTAHAGALLLGYDPYYAEIFLGAPFGMSLLLIALSIRFGFCALHKALIAYDFSVEVCILLQWLDVFGQTVTFFRWLMFIIGILLCLSVLFKIKFFNSYVFRRQ